MFEQYYYQVENDRSYLQYNYLLQMYHIWHDLLGIVYYRKGN
jgi:hypothetical protein